MLYSLLKPEMKNKEKCKVVLTFKSCDGILNEAIIMFNTAISDRAEINQKGNAL